MAPAPRRVATPGPADHAQSPPATLPTTPSRRIFSHLVVGIAAVAGLAVALALPLAAPARAAEAPPSHPFLFSLHGEVREPGHIPIPPPEAELEDACGVAVDSAGDLYISEYYHHLIDVYGPFHEYLTQFADPDPDGPCNLAVDSSGDVYVNNWHRDVVRFAPSEFPPTEATRYGSETTIDFPSAAGARSTGVAIDPATGRVYVDDRTYVAVYEPSGTLIDKIGEGTLGQGYGVAVSDFPATAGDVYVPDAASNTVRVFGPAGESLPPIDGAGTPQRDFDSLYDSNGAIDQSDGHLFVADNTEPGFESPAAVVDEFNPAGAYRGQLPHAIVDAGPTALAVDGHGNVYATSGNSEAATLLGFGPTVAAHTLTVAKIGTGEGTVPSEPDGINCGAACSAEFNAGGEVTLTAVPTPSSTFVGWSGGGCSGSRLCHVTLAADTEVAAEFQALPQQTLTVAKEGAGPGTITSSPAGINCTANCEADFNEGATVTLAAKPAALGSAFSGWTVNGSAAACPGTGPCQVTMSAAKSVSASFDAVPVHTLRVEEGGAGTVSSQPAGIDCGATCEAEYNQGTELTLTATPRPHQAFTGWSGGGCSGTGACKVALGADTALSASFAPILHTFTVTKSGSGSGSVTSSPAGIDCGSTCTAVYEDGRQLTLHATPAPGSSFSGWSGGGCSGTGACLLILGSDTSLSANFAPIPAPAAPAPTPPADRLTLGPATSSPSGASATLALTVPAPGLLSVSGKGLQSAKAKAMAPGAITLALTLSDAGRKALREARRKRLTVKVAVTFTPSAGGAPLTATKLVIFKAKGKPKGEAQLTQKGELFAAFNGGIRPGALPRRRRAPISVLVSGTITTLSGAQPPALREISIALNRAGHLDTRGLPVCHIAQIRSTSSEQARAACGPALVGGGSYAANTAFPEQPGFPFRGHILAFNSVSHGHPAILAHVYGINPSPTTRIVVFSIRHTPGTFGTVLSGELPPALNRYGYLKSIDLSLHRLFAYRGTTHSYISAACAAPSGFPGASFPFARTTMTFADGRILSSTLTRSCTVAK